MPTLTASALALSIFVSQAPPDDEFLTVAEASDFRATATHAEVLALAERLAARSDVVHLTELGRTEDGKAIPLLVIADPPVTTPGDVDRDERLVVFGFGNIHGGEVCGKEALMMLARELALTPEHPLLEDLVVLIAPVYNADGNDRMAPGNRRGQVGPVEGMGERANSKGLDLNRDYVKLEAAETRALVRLFNEWDPQLTIDTHTTNGSQHRYTLTYDSPLHPSSPDDQVRFLRDRLLPEVGERMLERTGYDTIFYGNFNRDHTVWYTYSGLPRYGANYQGLRGQMHILSEAYAYASYRDRVLATLEFVREIFRYAAAHEDEVRDLHRAARRRTTEAGRRPQPHDTVALRLRPSASTRPLVVRGYARQRNRSDEPAPAEHTVVHVGGFEPALSVARPLGYLVPAELQAVRDVLLAHGVEMERAEGPVTGTRYTVTAIERAARPFQGHVTVILEVDAAPIRINAPAGAWLVRTAQPLGTLAVCLLEPQSEDGLAAWNFLDAHLAEGRPYPILRVDSVDPAATSGGGR